jgi:hypothetical protein
MTQIDHAAQIAIQRDYPGRQIPQTMYQLAAQHAQITETVIRAAMKRGDAPKFEKKPGGRGEYLAALAEYLLKLAAPPMETPKPEPKAEASPPSEPDAPTPPKPHSLRRVVAAPGEGPRPMRSSKAPAGHVRTTVNLPEDLHYALRSLALTRRITLTDLIIQLATEATGGK